MVQVTQTMNTLYGLYFQEISNKSGKAGKPVNSADPKPSFYLGAPVGPRKRPLHPLNRILRVQGKIKCNKGSESHHPEIKLSGLWLKDIGFEEGQKVLIKTTFQKISIEIIPP